MAVLPTKFEHKTREAMFPGTPGSEGFFGVGGGQPQDTLTLPGINGQPHGPKLEHIRGACRMYIADFQFYRFYVSFFSNLLFKPRPPSRVYVVK